LTWEKIQRLQEVLNRQVQKLPRLEDEEKMANALKARKAQKSEEKSKKEEKEARQTEIQADNVKQSKKTRYDDEKSKVEHKEARRTVNEAAKMRPCTSKTALKKTRPISSHPATPTSKKSKTSSSGKVEIQTLQNTATGQLTIDVTMNQSDQQVTFGSTRQLGFIFS